MKYLLVLLLFVSCADSQKWAPNVEVSYSGSDLSFSNTDTVSINGTVRVDTAIGKAYGENIESLNPGDVKTMSIGGHLRWGPTIGVTLYDKSNSRFSIKYYFIRKNNQLVERTPETMDEAIRLGAEWLRLN